MGRIQLLRGQSTGREDETENTRRTAPVREAVAVLRKGGLVAFPTETVYGLGGDAENPSAVERIFSTKGRPADHPLIVHIPSPGQLERWAREIPHEAWKLAERHWPGPLTLILRKSDRIPGIVTGGQDTVGLRVPDHPVALALLNECGGAIAAPSANRFGRVSPTTSSHVREEFGNTLDCILDGGPCRVGIESTILDLSANRPRLLRPGAITVPEIESLLGLPVSMPGNDAPRAPGRMSSHYAPNTPVFLIPAAQMEAEILRRLAGGQRVAVLAMSPPPLPGDCFHHSMPDTPAGWARELYARLRTLDRQRFDCILVEMPPAELAWQAVRDRLDRASSSGTPAGDNKPVDPNKGSSGTPSS